MRRDIEFKSEGVTCRGWFYRPDAMAKSQRLPTIVMAHGFGGVKEVRLDKFAEGFAAAGFQCLVFDYRTTGSSDGVPRQQWMPDIQIADFRNAVSFARGLPEVDPERIGLWGTSFGGGHVISVGAVDRRVKCIVALVPFLDGRESAKVMIGEAALGEGMKQMIAERERIAAGGAPAQVPIAALNGEPQAILNDPAEIAWARLAAVPVPTWVNWVTSPSVEALFEYCPIALIDRVAPTPLLLIASETDAVIPLALSQAAFARALEPKRLKVLPFAHFEIYEAPARSAAISEAVDWFAKHLR
ncbi:MAG: alpha/beta hydrolase [Nevskiales bacterium]